MKLISKQPHRSTCGVVAYANLLKLMGRKMSYKKAIKRAGGLKKFKTGMKVWQLVALLQKDFNVYVLKLPLKEVKLLAADKECAVAVCYWWMGKQGETGHVAAMSRKGRSVNTNKHRAVKPSTWKYKNRPPATIIITEKD